MIRMWSQRFEVGGDYMLADYDPETRTLHLLEGRQAGTSFHWEGEGEPWDAPGTVEIVYDDGERAQAGPFPAMWERAVEGQPPSPGYGTTPSEDELFIGELLSGFGLEL